MALLLTAGALAPSMVSLFLSNPSSRLSFSHTQTLGGGRALSLPSPNSLSLFAVTALPFQPNPSVYCGRGDKKTAKGKRFKHSFGNARPRNKQKGNGPPRVPAPPAPPRKDKFDDGEIVKIEIDESLFS